MHPHVNPACHEQGDEAIIALLDSDVTAAFKKIYNDYWLELYKFAFVRIKNQELAENIVQDIFISLWQSIDTLQISTSISAYLFSAAQYRVYSTIKKENLFVKYLDHAATLPAVTAHDPQEIYQAKELQQQISEKITDLPAKTREVFLLSREEGLNTKEIASRLHISPRTVETHIHNSLKYLRMAFKAEPE